MRSGRLDRLITIQQPTEVADTFGGNNTVTWSDFANAWANVSQVSAMERFQSSERLSIKASKFKIRFISGIKPTFRIRYDNFNWRILGISELERLEGLEILAETISPFDLPDVPGEPSGLLLSITRP